MRTIVLICCAAALLAAGASIFVAGRYDTALMSAVALLACAQIVALIAAQRPKEIDDARLAGLSDRINRNSADIDRLSTRTRDQAQELSTIAQALKSSRPPAGTRETVQVFAPVPRPAPALAPRRGNPPALHSVAPNAGHAADQASPLARATLHLEPVVRVAEGRTAYYKATLHRQPQTPGRPGQPVVSADLASPAGAAIQWDPQHDVTLMKEVILIVQTLQARRAATGILVPVSNATLDDPGRLQVLVNMLYQNPEAAAGLVLDIHVSALASLPDSAMQGLAWLASLGASFCLTGAWTSDNDLDALADLGFTFIDVPGGQLVSPQAQVLPAAQRLLARAAALNMSVIASGVTDAAQAASVLPVAALARGPAFALPRAVRANLAEPGIQQQVA